MSQAEKPKANTSDMDSDNSDEDFVKTMSTEETKEGTESAETSLSNAFWDLLPHLSDFFRKCESGDAQTKSLVTTFSEEKQVPLG